MSIDRRRPLATAGDVPCLWSPDAEVGVCWEASPMRRPRSDGRASPAARGRETSGIPLARSLVLAAGTVALSALLVTVAPAAEVTFPLTVDYDVLRIALRKHLGQETGGALELWRTPDGCGTFVVRDPVLEPTDRRLRITGPASATAGLPMLGWCFGSLTWNGHAEIVARPELGHDWQLRLRDIDFQLYNTARQPANVATRLWTVVRDWSAAELETFGLDLGPPVEDVRTLLRSFSAPSGSLAAALQTLRPRELAVEPDALRLRVALDLPPAPPIPAAPERALSRAEIQQWEALVDSWDGFLGFLVKDLAGGADPETRTELLDALLTARREVTAVLARGPEGGIDPIRPLFLRLWERLRGIVRRASIKTGDDARALRYIVFLAAGDALTAIEAAAPAAGLDFSANGLRRLARTLAPSYGGDPLEYSDAPDPKLQELFRLRDPDAPPRRLRRKPPAAPRSWLLPWLTPRAAQAEEPDEWRELSDRLDRWVPAPNELPAYRDIVDRLLSLAAERSFDGEAVGERFDDLFRDLVKAVAWQESCWRQFVRDRTGVVPIQSSTGDFGMMQINVRVWRGFFNPVKLRWSAGYNAGAGTEILWQLLGRYGTREAGVRLSDAARASYSAYHGGPRRYRRYRLPDTPPEMRLIDQAFWEKYQAVSTGQAGDRVLCMPVRRAS
jgi:Transglycosylase SLT domain